jgi:hypothetical protein
MARGWKLSYAERGKIAEKLMDWGNLVFVGLAITQVFSGVPLTLVRVFVGALALAGAYWFAIRLMEGGD